MSDYQIYLTTLKMLYKRGYKTTEPLPFEEFKKIENFTILTETREDYPIKKGSIYVFFAMNQGKTLGVKPIRTFIDEMKLIDCKRSIVITKEGITPIGNKKIQETEDIIMEIFTESELLFDITEHILVPKHELLTPEAKKELLTRFKETQLQQIQQNDPVAKYYGLEKSDIVKITRISETAGYHVGYRVVS